MLDLYTRTAILRMSKEGHGSIKIAKTLGLSRNAVRKVIRSGQARGARPRARRAADGLARARARAVRRLPRQSRARRTPWMRRGFPLAMTRPASQVDSV